MLTVHHLENSRSTRILWLLEELEVPYDVKHYARDPKSQLAPAALKQVHPLGKAPVLTDNGTTIAETGAIVEYILERHGNGRLEPADADRLRHRFWMHFAEGSAMPPLVITIVFDEIVKRAPGFIRAIPQLLRATVHKSYLDPTIKAQRDYMEQELAATGWFAGPDLTAADIMMLTPVQGARTRFGVDRYPNIAAWLARVEARPAFQKAEAQ